MDTSLIIVIVSTVATLIIQVVKLIRRSSCFGCNFETRRSNSNVSLLDNNEDNNKE